MNYLDILCQIDKDYHGMSNHEIIKKLEAPSNNIKIINDVKNFIFENGFSLDIHVISSYLICYTSYDMVVEDVLVEQYLKIINNPHALDKFKNKQKITFQDLENIKYDFNMCNWPNFKVYGIFFKQIPDYIKILQTIILFILRKTKVLDTSNIKNIDISMIKKSYNNFFIKNQEVVINKSKDIYTDINVKKFSKILMYNIVNNKDISIFSDDNNVNILEIKNLIITSKDVSNQHSNGNNNFIIENTVNNSNVNNVNNDSNEYTRNIYSTNRSLFNIVFYKNGISVATFNLPYKKKEIELFKIDYNDLTNVTSQFDTNSTILFFKLCQKYTELTKNIIDKQSNVIDNYQNENLMYKIEDNKIFRYYFDCYDKDKSNNYLIAYNFINEFINNNFNQNIFTNYEYNKTKDEIQKVISCKDNKCFIVLDLCKAFYNTRLTYIVDELSNKFSSNKNLCMYLNILFEFFETIQTNHFKYNYIKNKTYDHLPITSFSQLLFKLYMICLFKNSKAENTFISYVDDFIIYGNRDNIFERFDNFYNIIKIDYTISTIKIYDKLLHNKLNIIKTDFDFNTTIDEEIEAFTSNNTSIDNVTIKMKLEMSLEQRLDTDKVSNTVIDIVSPEQLLNLFNMIPNNDKKKISKFTKNEEDLCKICYVHKQSHALDICGHIFCNECLNQIKNKKCPYCKTEFGKFIKLYNI